MGLAAPSGCHVGGMSLPGSCASGRVGELIATPAFSGTPRAALPTGQQLAERFESLDLGGGNSPPPGMTTGLASGRLGDFTAPNTGNSARPLVSAAANCDSDAGLA